MKSKCIVCKKKEEMNKEEIKRLEKEIGKLPKCWTEVKITPKIFNVGEWNSSDEFIHNLVEEIVPDKLKMGKYTDVKRISADKKLMDKIFKMSGEKVMKVFEKETKKNLQVKKIIKKIRRPARKVIK